MTRLPNFLIVGSMKSATSTLYEQLGAQSGIYLPELKEPNYFSNDEQYRKGLDWYQSLFSQALVTDILGEASTHYTKNPTYPDCVPRIKHVLKNVKIIYVMRHPVDRLISHYMHGWSQREISVPIDLAITKHPELIDYGRYHYQLQPYFDHFENSQILPVFFERLIQAPQVELERICNHIGYQGNPTWVTELPPKNISKDRVRHFPSSQLLIGNPVATTLRRWLVPRAIRDRIKKNLQLEERPKLSENNHNKVISAFNDDLEKLGKLLGITLSCHNFTKSVSLRSIDWLPTSAK